MIIGDMFHHCGMYQVDRSASQCGQVGKSSDNWG